MSDHQTPEAPVTEALRTALSHADKRVIGGGGLIIANAYAELDTLLATVARLEAENADFRRILNDVPDLEADSKLLDRLNIERQPIVEEYVGCDADPAQQLVGYLWQVPGQCETVREAIAALSPAPAPEGTSDA